MNQEKMVALPSVKGVSLFTPIQKKIPCGSEAYIAYDTETSGVSVIDSQVIQIAGIICDKHLVPITSFNMAVKFDAKNNKWSKEAEEVHGISLEKAMKSGYLPNEAIKEFKSIVKKTLPDISPSNISMIAANAGFDYYMTSSLVDRYAPGSRLPISHRLVDVNCLGGHFLGKRSLSGILESLNIYPDESKKHDALYDSVLHLAAYRGIVSRINNLVV